MPPVWPQLAYEDWSATCDTLHAHTQVLGKLAVALAPPEPQLQHAALRLTARGWETLPLPAPDGSGALVVALDLHNHEAVAEHSDGRSSDSPWRPTGPSPTSRGTCSQRCAAWAAPSRSIRPRRKCRGACRSTRTASTRRIDPEQVSAYFAAATQAALVLAEFRAAYRGRSTPVNAWWGSFDLAVSLFSGLPAEPPSDDFIMRNAMDSQEVAVGWWPGDARYGRAAFYAYAHPAPDGFADGNCRPRGGALGRRSSASTCSTGTTSATAPTRTPPHWSSPGLCSATPASCATGIPRSPPAPREPRRRSSEHQGRAASQASSLLRSAA